MSLNYNGINLQVDKFEKQGFVRNVGHPHEAIYVFMVIL